MRVEILVEEPSMKVALDNLIPKILGPEADFEVYSHEGKPAMLKRLPKRLQGYSSRLRAGELRLLILVDRDGENCVQLKNVLEKMAERAGLATKTAPQRGGYQLVNRIVVEELEAWFFGDLAALRRIYPKVDANLGAKAPYRDPDSIQGGTWEALESVLQEAGYHLAGLPKIEVARAVSKHMSPARNTSRSFASFVEGLKAAASKQ